MLDKGAAVIGVTHVDIQTDCDLDGYFEALEARSLSTPVFPLDARNKDDVLVLVDALLVSLENQLIGAK